MPLTSSTARKVLFPAAAWSFSTPPPQAGGAGGGSGSARVEGVFLLPKAGEVVAQGAPLYADMNTGEVSTTAEGKVYAGRAWKGALSESSVVSCRLNFMQPVPAADGGESV